MNRINQMRCEKLASDIADLVSLSPALYEAFKSVDRSEFTEISANAFELNPQLIAKNQWISSPLTVAKMTMALDLDDAENALEIGCGSGYQAAILSKIIRRVFAVERIEKLAIKARAKFAKLGISNVHVLYDDGNAGWKAYAPYDRILLSAAAKSIDKRLFAQLKDGGILVAPMVFEDGQKIVKFEKKNEKITEEILGECEFVPLLEGKI